MLLGSFRIMQRRSRRGLAGAERERGRDLGEVIVLSVDWRGRVLCYALTDDGLFNRLVEVPRDALASWCKLKPEPADQNLLVVREDRLTDIWVGRQGDRTLPPRRERRRALARARAHDRPLVFWTDGELAAGQVA